MNFLAHIYLSGTDVELRIGNFIGDFVKGKAYLDYSLAIQKGILLHRAIDTFTDTHPIVRKSKRRLFPIYRHYSSVIVDVYYDHYLAAQWQKYSEEPLNTYTSMFYKDLQEHYDLLPPAVQRMLPSMLKSNWLYSYRTVDGIEKILQQMSRRTRFESKMENSGQELRLYYQQFQYEFDEFFPELEKYVVTYLG